MSDIKYPPTKVAIGYGDLRYVSVRADECVGLRQPDVGAALAATIRAQELEPEEGWNPDGIPADILYRAEWIVDRNKDGTVNPVGGRWQHDLFLVACRVKK